MNIAAYYLILSLISGYGAALSATPMQTLAHCEQAAKQAEELAGVLSTVRAVCVKAAE